MNEFTIVYKDKKLTVIVNGKEMKNARHVEIIVPIYTDPLIKINQHIGSGDGFDQSVMTAITGVTEVNISGSLR